MYPNQYSGTRAYGGYPATRIVNNDPYRSTPSQARPTNPQSGRPSHATHTEPSQGMTTNIRAGDPHYYGTRLVRAESRLINPLCRCQDPNSHHDAWAYSAEEFYAEDIRGWPISWTEASIRILNHYNKNEISREEEIAALRYVVTPREYASFRQHYHMLDMVIGMGGKIRIGPNPENYQFHNGDGHAQNNVTEGGLRTVVNRTGETRWSGHGASRG